MAYEKNSPRVGWIKIYTKDNTIIQYLQLNLCGWLKEEGWLSHVSIEFQTTTKKSKNRIDLIPSIYQSNSKKIIRIDSSRELASAVMEIKRWLTEIL